MQNHIDAVVKVINSVRLPYSNEAALQEQLGQLLRQHFDVAPEHRLSARDRVDFLVKLPECKIALECKVKGSPQIVVSQLARYAESKEIDAIILVTSVRRHLTFEAFRENEILGKPLRGIWIGGM